jgi:hypothetical protein
MASTVANKIKYLMATKIIDFSADTFKIALMQSGFTFNKDTHHVYADVSASELATANGYTAGGATLGGVALTEDDTDDRTEVVWTNPTWVAVLGAIGPTPGAIVYDDTVAAPVAKPIVGYIDFAGDQTQADGGTATISGVEFRLA